MAISFEFASAGRVIFGSGRASEIPKLAREMGRSVLLVTGRNRERSASLAAGLRESGMPVRFLAVMSEPQLEDVRCGLNEASQLEDPVIIGMGGGSVIDAAKAIAVMLRQTGDVLDFLEVVGRGVPLQNASAPCIAVPTTAGTGTEVTRNAVLASPEHRVKASLRVQAMLPRLAVVDPGLCLGLPASITASTGMDALTQLIEPFVSARANPMIDALCLEGIMRSTRSLRRAIQTPDDLGAREDLCLASLHSGWALANAGLGAVHGFAAPIGGMFKAPHGAVCAALLGPVMRANLETLRSVSPAHPSVPKFTRIAELLIGCAGVEAMDGIRAVQMLTADLGIPGLREYGIVPADFPAIAQAAQKASSMKANPVQLDQSSLVSILESAW